MGSRAAFLLGVQRGTRILISYALGLLQVEILLQPIPALVRTLLC